MQASSPSHAHSRSLNRISLDNNKLIISFPYDAKKVAALKKIRGAKFNKQEKNWTLSINGYFQLKKIAIFSRGAFSYDFTEQEFYARKNRLKKGKGEATKRINKNPFSVSTDDILLADPDYVFYIKENKLFLKTKKKNKFLENFPGVQEVKKENAFFLEVTKLNPLLKLLRDRNQSFAVEETAGFALKKSAELRNALLENKIEATSKSLKEAFLVPYLCRIDSHYALEHYTNEQLQALFPTLDSFQKRKAAAKNLDEDNLIRALSCAKSSGIRLFLTSELKTLIEKKSQGFGRFIEKNPENFPIEILACYTPQIFFHLLDKEPLLFIEKEYLKKISTNSIFNKKSLCLRKEFPEHYAFSENDFSEFYKKVKSELTEAIPTSELFISYLENLKLQHEKLEKRNYYQKLKDCDAELENKDLEKKLFPHQRVAVKWLKENNSALLGDDMGLGKTLSVLASFNDLKEKDELDFLLVVSPNSLTRNWLKEARLWTPRLALHNLPQGKEKRLRALEKLSRISENFDGLVLNFEVSRLDYVLEKLVEILSTRRVLFCVDESQRAKNAQSKTFSALRILAEHADRKVLLSGTPIPKDISDIWSQVYLLDGGERFGKNYYQWLEKIAVLGNKFSEYAVKSFRKEGVEKVIPRVQEILLRRKKEDVVDLPEKTFSERYVELKGEQKKRYEEVRKELLLRVSAVDGKTYTKEISSILEEYLRAVQIASNPRLVDETWEGEPAKFLELDEIVKEIVAESGKKLVIWTSYVKNTEDLAVRYKDHGTRIFNGNISADEREKTISEFQDLENSNVKILIAIPAAGGVGITLTATQTAVYLDKTWNAEHWLQSIDRIHRIGQNGSVQIISLNSTPVDYLVQGNLRKKEEMQKKLLGDKLENINQLDLLPTKEELLEAVKGK